RRRWGRVGGGPDDAESGRSSSTAERNWVQDPERRAESQNRSLLELMVLELSREISGLGCVKGPKLEGLFVSGLSCKFFPAAIEYGAAPAQGWVLVAAAGRLSGGVGGRR